MPITDEVILKKKVYLNTMAYFSAIKNNDVQIHTTTT